MEVDPRAAQVLRWILADTENDFGQLWSLAKEVECAFILVGWEEVREMTLGNLEPLVARDVLHLGHLAVQPSGPSSFVRSSGGPDHQIASLRLAWDSLARMPTVGELGWYDLTDAGRFEILARVRASSS